MLSGNWHPSASIQYGFWAIVGFAVLCLLIFTEIGRSLIMLAFGGSLIWAFLTRRLSSLVDFAPDSLMNFLTLMFVAFIVWIYLSSSISRVNATKKKYPVLKGFALITKRGVKVKKNISHAIRTKRRLSLPLALIGFVVFMIGAYEVRMA